MPFERKHDLQYREPPGGGFGARPMQVDGPVRFGYPRVEMFVWARALHSIKPNEPAGEDTVSIRSQTTTQTSPSSSNQFPYYCMYLTLPYSTPFNSNSTPYPTLARSDKEAKAGGGAAAAGEVGEARVLAAKHLLDQAVALKVERASLRLEFSNKIRSYDEQTSLQVWRMVSCTRSLCSTGMCVVLQYAWMKNVTFGAYVLFFRAVPFCRYFPVSLRAGHVASYSSFKSFCLHVPSDCCIPTWAS